MCKWSDLIAGKQTSINRACKQHIQSIAQLSKDNVKISPVLTTVLVRKITIKVDAS